MTATEATDLERAAAIGMLPAYWAQRRPDAPAILCEHGDRTFAQANANANRLLRALRARGVRAGDGVALLCGNRAEFAETAAAVQRGGLRLTPVNWHLTADEAGYIVDDCDATAFVADARFAQTAQAAAKQAPGLCALVAVGDDIPGFEPWADALESEDGSDIDDPVVGTTMIYTSGTTGRPKGVDRRADPAATLALARATRYDADAHVHLCTGPLYHAAPLAFSLSGPAAGGVPVVLMDGWDAAEALRLVEHHRVTHTHMVPTMFHRLLSLPDDVKSRFDVSSLLFVLHGAAPCPVSVKQRLIEWLGPIVWEYYAATEGAGTLIGSAEWLRKPGTVGKPAPADHVKILDDDRREVPAGTIGTVYLKAPGTRDTGRFQYYKSPEKTAGAYLGEYFTLGDVGYLDGDGYLFLTDRSAHLIISGGVNVYPAEVEAALIMHPAVGDVGVIGVPDDEWGEIVVAVVEAQPGIDASDALASELVDWCRERIAHYKCPRRVEFVDRLPRHDNGKLYKHVLRDQFRAGIGGSDARVNGETA